MLSNQERSMTVGIAKEFMDARPRGSGFSFADLTADPAVRLFAAEATRNQGSARRMHSRIRKAVVVSDYCPMTEGFPEGLWLDEFQLEYGGPGRAKTNTMVQEIRKRLAECDGFEFSADQASQARSIRCEQLRILSNK